MVGFGRERVLNKARVASSGFGRYTTALTHLARTAHWLLATSEYCLLTPSDILRCEGMMFPHAICE